MCVIIIKQKGKTVLKEVAKTSAKLNPDGLGVIWLDTFDVTYHLSSEHKVLDTERPYIAHFRYATIGAIGKGNTHPFRCGANKDEWLMMNGTIRALGSDKMSDTRVLANHLGDIPRQKWRAELSKYECRFVSVNTKSKTYQIYNRDLWVKKDGVWFSKDNVVEDNVIAVYGTLKKGFNNYAYLKDSKYVGKGKTKDKYPLVISGLPYLIDNAGKGHNVEVDVFRVSGSTLATLDRLEGHPNWYCRRQIMVKIKGGVEVSCWVYFNIKEVAEGKVHHKKFSQPRIPTTFWENMYVPTKLLLDPLECDDCEFDIENEKPICINCSHDLEHDSFANYHCSGCDEWFTESEVVRFQP